MSQESTEQQVTDQTYEALYNINKHAKRYAKKADESYRNGKKTTARKNSVRKQALYDLKSEVLSRIKPQADAVEVHQINGQKFYCFYFADWSFHTPLDELLVNPETIDDEKTLSDFEKDDSKERSDMSLKAALLHLEETFDESANDHLEQKRVSYGHERYFIGWKYLD